ncbi:MAG TPA: glycosyltransferase family A protein [Saprospiraceae bacterium]|nr:glycosyltransferase family A protein [Saprospiraceae bacterium]
MNPFKISVIIPCYNQAHYLPDALYSLQEQDYTDWEAIVVNDGSTDDTENVARSFAEDDHRIQVISKSNGGLSSARNAGMLAATGSILQFLDADDCILPDCYQHVVTAAQKHRDSCLIQTGYRYCYGAERTILHTSIPQQENQLLPGILEGNAGPVHSMFIRTQAAKAAGLFDESLKSAEDWDFWMRVAKSGHGDLHVIQMPLVDYRIVDESMSRNAFAMYEALKTVLLRAPSKDNRICADSPLNKAYSIDTASSLKRILLMCLGVSVMQGKIEPSVQLMKQEQQQQQLQFQGSDFAMMCSYLSFRYRYDPAFTQFVLEQLRPRFHHFFSALGYSASFSNRLLAVVFQKHLQVNRHRKFGFMAPVLNRMANLKYKYL